MKKPSPEALKAATEYIDKQIANAVRYGGDPPDELNRIIAIYETARLTDRWMSLAPAANPPAKDPR
jgi:hypothetical protein